MTDSAAPLAVPHRGRSSLSPLEHVLTLECPETPDIVDAVSRFLVEHGCDVHDDQQSGEQLDEHGRFFMRVHFSARSSAGLSPHRAESTTKTLRQEFATVADRFGMRWRLEPAATRRRVLIMVSRYGHCLNDLLFGARNEDLPIDVVAVVGDRRDHEDLVAWHGVPFFHVPVTPENKKVAEAQLLDLVNTLAVDLVVLAGYMQVLSDDVCDQLTGRAINIHHSSLPSLEGAKPHHQASEDGVELVGATAHYVTPDVDEGPIIARETRDTDRGHTPEALAAIGRDAEADALSRAVRWHAEGRVFIQGRRTVVLR